MEQRQGSQPGILADLVTYAQELQQSVVNEALRLKTVEAQEDAFDLIQVIGALSKAVERVQEGRVSAGLSADIYIRHGSEPPEVPDTSGPRQAPPDDYQSSFTFDPVNALVSFNGNTVHLTPTETVLFSCLRANMGTVVPTEELIKALHPEWDETSQRHRRTVGEYVSRLRPKLAGDDDDNKNLILSIPGEGYVLLEPD